MLKEWFKTLIKKTQTFIQNKNHKIDILIVTSSIINYMLFSLANAHTSTYGQISQPPLVGRKPVRKQKK